MDLFEKWLEKRENNDLIKRALVDKSYKTALSRNKLPEVKTNEDLATVGDAVVKLCLSEIFIDRCEKLSKTMEQFETDEFFVTRIATRYDLLSFIQYDNEDEKMPKDYNYVKGKKGRNKHKYIATAVEAVIGVIFLETKDMEQIKKLVEMWTKSENK